MSKEKKLPLPSTSASYKKRKTTLKKKAEELSILCGVPVGLVCYDPDGKLDTWPEDKKKVDEILTEFVSKQKLINQADKSKKKKKKKHKNLDQNQDQETNTNKRAGKDHVAYQTWDEKFDYLSEESLMEVLKVIECKEKELEERLKNNAEEKGSKSTKRKRIQFNDEEDDNGLDVTLRLGCYDFNNNASSSSSGYGAKEKGSCSTAATSTDLDLGLHLGMSGSDVTNKAKAAAAPITMQWLSNKSIDFLKL